MNGSPFSTGTSNLSRSDQLEILIARVARVIKDREGLAVEDWLEKYEKKEVVDTGVSTVEDDLNEINSSKATISHHNSTSTSDTTAPVEGDTLVDISPLILKALGIRKKLLSSALNLKEAELEVQGLLIGTNESQEKQIRRWSGI